MEGYFVNVCRILLLLIIQEVYVLYSYIQQIAFNKCIKKKLERNFNFLVYCKSNIN